MLSKHLVSLEVRDPAVFGTTAEPGEKALPDAPLPDQPRSIAGGFRCRRQLNSREAALASSFLPPALAFPRLQLVDLLEATYVVTGDGFFQP